MSWPHALSLSRVAAGPLVAALVLAGPVNGLIWAAIIFTIASLTDLLDGPLARRARSVSPLGIYLDTTADKVFVSVVLVAMAIGHLIDAWVVMVIVGREFLVSGIRTLGAVEGVVITANYAGKVKATVTMVSIVAVLLIADVSRGGLLHSLGHVRLFVGIGWWMMLASVALTVQSGASYVWGARRLLAAPVPGTGIPIDKPPALRGARSAGRRG